MKNIIDKVLERKEFTDEPPVLLDIGASGAIHAKWRNIARHSVCIAFDADEREMGYVVKETNGFRKLYVFNCIVTATTVGVTDFYLTKSPYCSSILKPTEERLRDWSFADLFGIEKCIHLKATTLPSVLEELGIGKIDWFKVDSQGTDLRLFSSLGPDRIRRSIVAEFEPGILDAYQGEDKLWSVIAFMEHQPFWMSSLDVRGTHRISADVLDQKIGRAAWRWLSRVQTTAPGWAEMTYFRAFSEDTDRLNLRDYLLGWVFATIERHHAYALEIAARGFHRFGDGLFVELERNALRRIRLSYLDLPLYFLSRVLMSARTLVEEGVRQLS